MNSIEEQQHTRVSSTQKKFSLMIFGTVLLTGIWSICIFWDILASPLNPENLHEQHLMPNNIPIDTKKSIHELSEINQHQNSLRLDQPQELEPNFLRAFVGHLPTEKGEDNATTKKFGRQLKWLIRSWVEMRKTEPKQWRTDIVIITQTYIPLFRDLNCSQINRLNAVESSKCIIITGYVSSGKRYKEFQKYNFADSIDVLSYDNGALDIYDWLLRSDLDTFLTPGFSNWRPKKMIVGQGAYCFDGQITCHRLHRIARDMNFTDSGVDNVGSTWYGPTQVVKQCSKDSIYAMRHLHNWEFSDPEKSDETVRNVKGWPSWHYGVLTMYGGQLGINHCAAQIGFEKRPDMLDYETTSNDDCSKHAHLHTWQNNIQFSKFEFESGNYRGYNLSTLNLSKCKDYAMYMALISNPDYY